ncbi:RNA polymerase sigma factor [Aeromicrobium wangtongii]|uniref:RNA polymerase sigma factor n=1 Tax=Aeromicrobium wangtongii TaxID=2969247 RepID=A0ABY5M8I7_9ACTN|nr:sigma-70 family RNA polymerase sigma factor [Aeromicrobium wangtongii]MCD9199009.1 sigma-70 family RNA polymerase sigma factor [Aeromicrobium wangtongii]UUP12958.1 sigma-70 family RNA polymerase sigma factor [Aeromicrobium wangtongii]
MGVGSSLDDDGHPARAAADNPTEAPDEHIASAFAAGLDWALAEAFRRWAPLVHTIALRSLGHAADADDVTQQVFVQAWRSRGSYDAAIRPLPAWLTGVTRHAIADRMAMRARERNLALRLVRLAAPSVESVDVADAVYVGHLLDQLPQPRRGILELAYLGHHTHAEVAARTGLPLGTVKSHIRRGLADLRSHLEATDEPS